MGSPQGLAVARPWRRVAPWAAALGLVAALTGLVAPSRPGTYPTCPFLAVTGLACPGCGSLRAMHALTHGDLLVAFDRNALFVVVLAASAVIGVRTLADRHVTRPRRWAGPVAALLLILWTFARNLPVTPFPVLAP